MNATSQFVMGKEFLPFYTSLLLLGHTSPQRCLEQIEQSSLGNKDTEEKHKKEY